MNGRNVAECSAMETRELATFTNELLVQIRDKGNAVLVVEHEPDVIARADWVPYVPELLGKRVFPFGFPPGDHRHYAEAYEQPGALTAMLNDYRAAARDTPRGAGRRVPTFHAPTRVIWGRRGRYLTPGVAEPQRADVPNLERVIRLDTSHWVQHEAPEEVAELLIEFFSLT